MQTVRAEIEAILASGGRVEVTGDQTGDEAVAAHLANLRTAIGELQAAAVRLADAIDRADPHRAIPL